MALNFLNNGIFAGEVTISTIPAVGSDTDKFLMSNSGVISFATGAEVLSFIGVSVDDKCKFKFNYLQNF